MSMTDDEYRAGLDQLRRDWGSLSVDTERRPGVLVAKRDPTTGILVGRRAALIAEIINRALAAECEHCGGEGIEPVGRTFDAGDGEGEDRPCSVCCQ